MQGSLKGNVGVWEENQQVKKKSIAYPSREKSVECNNILPHLKTPFNLPYHTS